MIQLNSKTLLAVALVAVGFFVSRKASANTSPASYNGNIYANARDAQDVRDTDAIFANPSTPTGGSAGAIISPVPAPIPERYTGGYNPIPDKTNIGGGLTPAPEEIRFGIGGQIDPKTGARIFF